MPETPWGPDVAPHALEAFSTPATEAAWELWDSPVPFGAFQAPATEWIAHDWAIGYVMAAESGAVFVPRPSLVMRQAVKRSVEW